MLCLGSRRFVVAEAADETVTGSQLRMAEQRQFLCEDALSDWERQAENACVGLQQEKEGNLYKVKP